MTDEDGDEVTLTVSGLPSGLSYTNSLLQGTVSTSATAQDYTVTVSANDVVNPAVTGTFTITVTAPAPPANRPPEISVPGDQTYEQGQTITGIDFKVTDEDGDEVTLTVSGQPSGLSYTNSLLQGTVSADAATQDYTVTVSADDGVNAAVTGSFTITVTAPAPPANRPPQITVPGDQTYEQGQTITGIDFKVTDEDGDEVTLTVSGQPSGLSYTNSLLQGTVSADAATQDYTVTVSADDGVNAAVTGSFTITVTTPAPPANRPPQITVPGDQTYEQGQTITGIDFKVTDVDGDEVTTTVSGQPSGLSYTNSLLQGTVSSSATAQDYTVTVSADDGVNPAVTGTFTITVTEHATTPPANSPPQITVPGDQTYEQGQTITGIDFKVTDEDGDEVTTTVSGAPSGLSYTNSLLQGTVSSSATAQDYTVTVSADDGVNAAVTGSFTITVTTPATTPPANSPPEITVPGNKTFEQGETITAFWPTVSDADGDAVRLTLSGLPSGLSYRNGMVQGTVSATAATQDYTVTVSADDGVNPAVTATFTITVTEPGGTRPANRLPEITVPGDQTYEQGQTITGIDFKVTDEDGDEVTLTVSGLPSGLSYTNSLLQGTVSATAATQDYTVTVSADDGVNPAVTATFTITVTEPGSARPANRLPDITMPGDQTYEQGQTITGIDFKVTDEDGDEVTLTVSGLPSGLSYTNSLLQGTVSATAATQDYTVTVSADDGVNPAVTATFTITVTEPGGTRPANRLPDITMPGDRTYQQGETITAIDFKVTDEDGDEVTLTVSGLPSGLSYTNSLLQGTVSATAATQDYTVTVSADDGVNAAVTGTFTITITEAVTVTLSGPTNVQNGAFDVTVTFSENVTGFQQGDVTVGNGTVTAFSGSGDNYTATITPAASGTVTVDVAADVAIGAAGKGNEAADRFSVMADLDAPTVGITGPADAQNGPFDATITFSEDVTGFEQGDVTVGNGAVTAISGSGDSYTATVTPAATGTVTVDVAARVARDSAGNGNTAATRLSVQVDVDRPSVSITGPATTQTGAFDVSITFSEEVTGFQQSDIIVGNGTVTAFSGSGDSSTATITPTATGLVTVDVAANAAVDAAGNGNTAAGRLSVTASLDVSNPVLEIIAPEDKTYAQGETIASFGIPVINTGVGVSPGGAKRAFANADPLTAIEGDLAKVTVGGLPSGLSFTSRKVGGTVSADAEVKTYTVDIKAANVNGQLDDATFKITVTASTEMTVSDATAIEGDVLSFTVSLADSIPGGLTVAPVFGIGTASADVDYTPNTAPLSFKGTAGEEQTFSVATIEDEVVEAAETFSVSLAVSGTTAKVTGTVTATGTIVDDDAGGGATVTVADASAVEGEALSFTVRLARAVQGGLTVTPAFHNVTATSGTDYSENTSPLSFIGAAGEERTFTVSTVEDELEEEDETFTLSLVVSDAPSGVRAGGATGTIIDDDGARVYVSIHDPESPVAEGTSVELPVRMTSTVEGNVQVPWTTDGDAGPALASKIAIASDESGSDIRPAHEHVPSSGTATLAAGQLETTIEITILDDEEHEDLESFGITLGEPTVASSVSRRVSVDRRTATVTVLDNDAPPVFDEGDAAIRFVVENTPPGTAIGGPFLATDAENDPLSFALGGADAAAFALDPDSGQLRTREPLDFETRNSYDGLTVTVDDGHGHTDVLSLTVNVTDASPPDALDAPAVVRSSSDPESSLDVNWSAPADNGSPISDYDVRYREAGTATWRDHAFDGAGVRATLTGLKAASTYEVQVLAKNVEGAGEWSVSGRGSTLDPSAPRETVTTAGAGATEGATLTFAVTLNRTVQGGLTVTPRFSDGTAARGSEYAAKFTRRFSDRRATIGTDYNTSATGMRFEGTKGERHTFTVTTIQDEVVEYNETFTVRLDISGTSASGLTGGSATGTITDDDSGTVTTGNRKASEGDGLTFRVTLNRAVQGGLTVTPVFKDGTATAGIDYTASASPLTFAGAAGEAHTFTVATTEDEAVEANETFTVSLRVSNAPPGVTTGDPVTATIIDDDGRNEPPDFDDAGHATTRAVAENTPAGGPVGAPVEATDPNGDVLSYSLSGSDAFGIDSETGQIAVSEGVNLDYEAGPLSYAVTVTVNDGREGSDVIEVAISVTDAAEPPSAPAAPRVTAASLASVRLDWRAPANTGPAVSVYDVQYRMQGADDWTSHAFTGTKTTAEIRELESAATYEARVRAKNAEGTGAWSAPGSGRTRVNNAPVAVDDAVTVFRGRRTTSLWTGDPRNGTRSPSVQPPEDFDVPEPEAGAKIAPLANSVSATDDGHISVLANDVDAEDDWSLLTAILVDPPAYGHLTLNGNGTFIYTHDGSRAPEDRFTYRVEDSGGVSSDEATVTILITGVNLGPAVTGTIPDQVLTMGTNGRVDLTGLFVDPDGDPLSYEVLSDNGTVNASLVGKVIALTPVAVSTDRVTVTARDPYGLSAKLSFAVTVENIQTNRARALELSLAAFGRTVLSQAVDAVAGRFEATSRALRATLDGGRLVLGQAFNAMEWVHVAARLFGIPLDAPASRSSIATAEASGPNAVPPALRAPSGRSILTRSSFQMALDRSGSVENGWTLWGRGAGSRYSGDPTSDNRLDARVTAAYIGADYHWNSKLVVGLAASYSNGVQDLDNAGNSMGTWKTRLTSLRPYVHWSPTGKLGLWGMLGFGRGDAILNSGYGGPLAGTGSSTIQTDINSRSAALGGRMDLTRVGDVDLALTADAFAVSTVSEAGAGLRAATGDAQRIRMMVNGATGWSVTPDSRMDLSLALGARVDGGDVESGLGAELAGVLSFSNCRIGLDVEVRSHWLAAHQDRDFREGGLSLALRLDPGSDKKGLALSLAPEWGENASRGVDSIWKGGRMPAYQIGSDGLDWRPSRTRVALGYALETWEGRGRMEPFVEMDVADRGLHRLGGGLRLNLPGASVGSAGAGNSNLRMELLGEYRLTGLNAATGESATRGGSRDYRLGLSLFRDF